MTPELARRWSKELLTVAMLDQLEGMEPSVIEVNKNRFRGTCNSYSNGECQAVGPKRVPNSKYTVCSNCPLWSETDVLYEGITGRDIVQSYDWWRNEWIEYGIDYAFERMIAHVSEKELVKTTATTTVQEVSRREFIYVWSWRRPLNWGIEHREGSLRVAYAIGLIVVCAVLLLYCVQVFMMTPP